jgi:hypothetical protein
MAISSPWECSSATGTNGNMKDNATTDCGAVYLYFC